jgi:hypothetical protein
MANENFVSDPAVCQRKDPTMNSPNATAALEFHFPMRIGKPIPRPAAIRTLRTLIPNRIVCGTLSRN